MNADSQTGILALRPDVVVTTLEKEAVLLDLDTKYFYSVNNSGWAITQLFEGGATIAQARERAAEWGASTSGLEGVDAFLQMLVAERLVTETSEVGFEAEVAFDGVWSAPAITKHREPLQKVMVSAFDPTLPLAE